MQVVAVVVVQELEVVVELVVQVVVELVEIILVLVLLVLLASEGLVLLVSEEESTQCHPPSCGETTPVHQMQDDDRTTNPDLRYGRLEQHQHHQSEVPDSQGQHPVQRNLHGISPSNPQSQCGLLKVLHDMFFCQRQLRTAIREAMLPRPKHASSRTETRIKVH